MISSRAHRRDVKFLVKEAKNHMSDRTQNAALVIEACSSIPSKIVLDALQSALASAGDRKVVEDLMVSIAGSLVGAGHSANLVEVPLRSSNLHSARYERDESLLRVRFKSGSVYQYEGVTEDVFDSLCDAASSGSYFARKIREHYPTEKLDPLKAFVDTAKVLVTLPWTTPVEARQDGVGTVSWEVDGRFLTVVVYPDGSFTYVFTDEAGEMSDGGFELFEFSDVYGKLYE